MRFNQNAFFAVAYGLADEQARSKPSVSALSIGGLIKHATGVQKSWAQRAVSAPESPPRDDRPIEESWRSTRTSTLCVTMKPSHNCSTS